MIDYFAYSYNNPIDSDTRADYYQAQISNILFNANSKKSKSVEDFLLFTHKQKKQTQTTEQMLAMTKAFVSSV